MDKRSILLFFISLHICFSYSQGHDPEFQENNTDLFMEEGIMPISIRYSNKDIKKVTNDSVYITTWLKFRSAKTDWDSLEVRLRKRGNFRLKHCYYAPIKVKIKKKEAKETPFVGHKNLKLVLPCMVQRGNNDNIIKEYLAYKLYEMVSPYHFKTRLVQFTYVEEKPKNIKTHELKGIFIEDDKHVAKRIGGKVLESKTHPLNHTPLESVRNSFFQYMIGNTDYSTAYLHNCEMILLKGKIIPVPYDFDMAGMVNTSYATVSQINNEQLEIEDVRERMYRGFKRDPKIFQQVRMEFLANRPAILAEIEKCEDLFVSSREYKSTINYIEEFFEVLLSDLKFEREILNMARNK